MDYQKFNSNIENECIICFEDVNTKFYTKCLICNTVVHNHCFREWKRGSLERNKRCVHCRQYGTLLKKKRNFFQNILYSIYKLFTCNYCYPKK